ncbi:translation initiation factor IF-2-like [Myotis myotis]|uniref:Uncharacterized protein n=1 Tax=Myotis myotis TaxID=51298 RepID=A0A7J7U5I7_MYOMY|nr:translation initiation factor IF-2-like [Myotis myotis]KAF6308094.1 hypothetical protein mMyoMyo1_008872 [Myotis myotis]
MTSRSQHAARVPEGSRTPTAGLGQGPGPPERRGQGSRAAHLPHHRAGDAGCARRGTSRAPSPSPPGRPRICRPRSGPLAAPGRPRICLSPHLRAPRICRPRSEPFAAPGRPRICLSPHLRAPRICRPRSEPFAAPGRPRICLSPHLRAPRICRPRSEPFAAPGRPPPAPTAPLTRRRRCPRSPAGSGLLPLSFVFPADSASRPPAPAQVICGSGTAGNAPGTRARAEGPAGRPALSRHFCAWACPGPGGPTPAPGRVRDPVQVLPASRCAQHQPVRQFGEPPAPRGTSWSVSPKPLPVILTL